MPCHVTPFIKPGLVIAQSGNVEPPASDTLVEGCDYCGARSLEWRKCKLVCTNCRQINKSCADL